MGKCEYEIPHRRYSVPVLFLIEDILLVNLIDISGFLLFLKGDYNLVLTKLI